MNNMNEYLKFWEVELAKLNERLNDISSKDKRREDEISKAIHENCELFSIEKDFEKTKKIHKENMKLLDELSKIGDRRRKRILREFDRFSRKTRRKLKLKPADIDAIMNSLSKEDLNEIAKEFGLT